MDTCIIGSGPAGISIATRLAAQGQRVALVEGGGLAPTIRNQRLLVDEVHGAPYWPLENVRVRMLGGSGNRWGGISRPLDDLDFTARSWVPDSGWPITADDVAPYYRQAAEALRLGDSVPGEGDPTLDTDEFQVANYGHSPLIDYRAAYESRLRADPNVAVWLNTNVVGLTLAPTRDRLAAIETESFGGSRRRFTARNFVLAAGGIENARLLLASDVGNDHDVVGRYFMEHLHVPIGELTRAGALTDWSSYDLRDWPKLTRALVPTAAVQAEFDLMNASLAIGPTWYVGEPPFVRWDYRWRYLYDRMRGTTVLERLAGRLPRRFRGLTTHDVPTDATDPKLLVLYRGEQPPRAENRVVLSAKTDAFGRPRADLRWDLGELELGSVVRVAERFRRTVEARGWGQLSPLPSAWQSMVTGGPHHMGTTRMSDDPRLGVVDRDCRVHSVANLYVAGSSVYPTGGHANPTMTLVALALRLADHLAG